MVESVLPKNRVNFVNLLKMEEAFSSHPLSKQKRSWRKKTSQEHLYRMLCKLFPEEGTTFHILAFITFFKRNY